MCNPAFFSAAGSAGASLAAFGGPDLLMNVYQGKMDEGVAKYNAAQQRNEAIRTAEAGVEAENMLRSEGAAKIGRQKTQLAAGGVDLGSSGAQDILQTTAYETELDAMRIRRNTGDQVQAMDEGVRLTLLTGRNAKKMAYMRGVVGAVNTTMGSAKSFAGM